MPKEKKKKPFLCPYCMLPCASTGGVTKHIRIRHHRPPIHIYSRHRQYPAGPSRVAGNADLDGGDTSDMSDHLIIDDAEEQAQGDLDEVSGYLINNHTQGSLDV